MFQLTSTGVTSILYIAKQVQRYMDIVTKHIQLRKYPRADRSEVHDLISFPFFSVTMYNMP